MLKGVYIISVMTKEQAISEQIDEIMDTFQFGKVAQWMKQDRWTWAETDNQVPEEYSIRQEARSMLKRVASGRKNAYISCGGLTAQRYDGIDDDGKPWIRLSLQFGYQTLNDGTSYTA